jgi:hypothetical protein
MDWILKIDDNYNSYLKTNIFNLNESKKDYFYAKEAVAASSKDDIYNLDDVISINIDLKKNEVYYEGFRFIKI